MDWTEDIKCLYDILDWKETVQCTMHGLANKLLTPECKKLTIPCAGLTRKQGTM